MRHIDTANVAKHEHLPDVKHKGGVGALSFPPVNTGYDGVSGPARRTQGARVEVWPLVADDHGVWLVSGIDTWCSGDIDCPPHDAAQRILRDHAVADDVRLLHSTSWRAADGSIVLTYLAALDIEGPAHARWPASVAITPELVTAVGKPAPNPPTKRPAPRRIDVLLHGLRHLHFLILTDTSARTALSEPWKTQLEPFAATLSGMYESDDTATCSDPAAPHQ
ncbi:hypothetical protein [Nonomuraea sp. NPDC049400]|uniref:hypothetical protein n=1 Tax=Nonomuraea sp. NPDC049400 TaxID=3364352 RepID=UPI0037917916